MVVLVLLQLFQEQLPHTLVAVLATVVAQEELVVSEVVVIMKQQAQQTRAVAVEAQELVAVVAQAVQAS
jgi:hypothetical protein